MKMGFDETLEEVKERELIKEEALSLFESANDWIKYPNKRR
jgi:hypothetical protein